MALDSLAKEYLRKFVLPGTDDLKYMPYQYGTVRLTGASSGANPTKQELSNTRRVLVRY